MQHRFHHALILSCAIAAPAIAGPMIEMPVDPDGTYRVNVMRGYTASPLALGTTVQNVNNVNVGPASTRIINGDNWVYQWNGSSANDTNATATLRFTLKDTYSLKKFVHSYSGHRPATYSIRVSNTGFGSMTTVVNNAAAAFGTLTDTLGSPVLGKYIEYQWDDTTGSQYVLTQEFRAYAEAASNPRPLTTYSGFDLLQLNGKIGVPAMTIADTTVAVDGNGWTDPVSRAIDQTIGGPTENLDTYIRGTRNAGYVGTNDARFTIDLGQAYLTMGVNLGFYHGQGWSAGATVEISLDNINWNTVYNSNGNVDLVEALYGPQNVRYVRVTNKDSYGGALVRAEVIGIPEPASLSMLALGGLALTRRRR